MLKYEVDNLDDVSEAHKDLYKEGSDGKFTLQVSGVESSSSVEAIKSSLLRERENNAEYKNLGTPDKIKEKLADAGKIKNGGDNEIITQMRKDHADELSAKDGTITGMRKGGAVSELKSELAKCGVIEEGIDLLANAALHRIGFHSDGTLKILTPDGGMPMVGKAENGGATIKDLAEKLAESVPRLQRDEGKGGGGKPPRSGGGKPDGRKFHEYTGAELSAIRKADPAAYQHLVDEKNKGK